MLFFKKDRDKLKELSADSLHSSSRIDFHVAEAKRLSLDVSQNSEAILDVDDKCRANAEFWSDAHERLEIEISKFVNETRDQIYKLENTNSSILKMQRAIITWIIMLSATSIFSFLLYWEII